MTSLTPARRRPAALPAALAAVPAALLLAGCSLTAPNTAIKPYAPADGLQAELGDLLVRNMLVVSEGEGEPGVLVGALVNRGEEEKTVQVEVGGTVAEVDVPPGVSVALGRERPRPDSEASEIVSERIEVDEVETVAGGVIDLVVTEPGTGSVDLRVPVELPEGVYAEFTPGS